MTSTSRTCPTGYGNKTDVRRVVLSDGAEGLIVAGRELRNVSAEIDDTDALLPC